jgi:hypothetical protein
LTRKRTAKSASGLRTLNLSDAWKRARRARRTGLTWHAKGQLHQEPAGRTMKYILTNIARVTITLVDQYPVALEVVLTKKPKEQEVELVIT